MNICQEQSTTGKYYFMINKNNDNNQQIPYLGGNLISWIMDLN